MHHRNRGHQCKIQAIGSVSDRLFDQLRALNLPVGDYAVFGSGPLIVRGIVAVSNDLDIVCRGAAWDRACEIGEQEFLPEYDVTIASMFDGAISFGTKWGIGDFDVDELIDSAEILDALPFVRLEHVVSYKTARGSDKDKLHLKALAASSYP